MIALSPTSKQAKLLSFIKSEIKDRGLSPTLNEMADHIGLATRSGVHRLLVELEARGHIDRAPNLARGITLPAVCPCCGRPR